MGLTARTCVPSKNWDDILQGMSGDSIPDAQTILREALDALDMPRRAVPRWLDHLERYYRAHGGERSYGPCLSMLARLREILAEEAG